MNFGDRTRDPSLKSYPGSNHSRATVLWKLAKAKGSEGTVRHWQVMA